MHSMRARRSNKNVPQNWKKYLMLWHSGILGLIIFFEVEDVKHAL